MTPAEVQAARKFHRSASGDLYGAVGLAKIINRSAEEPAIRAQCDQLDIFTTHIPDFIAACGYSWITDIESYDMRVEAAYQRRALMMLGKLWVEMPDKLPLVSAVSNIIVVQEFATRFGHCSPKIGRKMCGLSRILSIPAAFVEFATWVFSGLRCWASHALGWSEDKGGDGGWSMVCTSVDHWAPKPFYHVASYELISRTLAEAGRDRELYGDNAALLIREQIPELAGPTGDVDPNSLYHFDQNAAYMAVEFAIAHELGHALISTEGPSDDAANEAGAHRIGCILLRLSASTRVLGWSRDTNDLMQAAIGMIFFWVLLEARIVLTDGLLRRASLTPGDRFKEIQALERGRSVVARDICSETISAVRNAGYAKEATMLAVMVDNSQSFLQDLGMTISALPDTAISSALAIAAATVS